MKNDKKSIKYRILEFFATWFYSGKSRKAPGTCGSLATLPFVYFIAYFYGIIGVIVFAVIVSLAGIPIADAYAKAINQKDPGEIVIDETAGQSIALILAGTNLYLYAAGFMLFRIFDITKPALIGWADKKIGGGLGIMTDDILAGIVSLICIAGFLIGASNGDWAAFTLYLQNLR